MIAQDEDAGQRGLAVCDRVIGWCCLLVVRLLQPVVGIDIAGRARQYCELWCGLCPDELVEYQDYVQAPVGTVIGIWPWSVMIIKNDDGTWRDAAIPHAPRYSTAQVCQLGPHHVYGWGSTWI